MNTPDDVLVRAAQTGDSLALNTLLERHYDRIHAVCRRIAGSSRDADDAAQETMIRIVRSIDRFDGRSAFSTWAYRIATNCSLDELRKRQRRPTLHAVGPDDTGPPEVADPAAESAVTASVDQLAIDAALADLAEEFRVPVVMRDVGDLDYAEIAETLGIPVGTVKSRIARGRRQLAAALDPAWNPGNQPGGSRRPTDEPPSMP